MFELKDTAKRADLGRWLETQRKSRGITAYALALAARITPNQVASVESGHKAYTVDTLIGYLSALEIDLVALLGKSAKSDEPKELKPLGRPPKPLAPLPALAWDTMHEGGNERWVRVREFIGKGGYNWARETSPGWLVTHVFFWGDYSWFIINDTEWIVKQGQGVDHEDCMRQIDAARREVIG